MVCCNGHLPSNNMIHVRDVTDTDSFSMETGTLTLLFDDQRMATRGGRSPGHPAQHWCKEGLRAKPQINWG